MVERLHFLIVYIGSAAVVAFLAACLSSPRVSQFTCEAGAADSAQQCALVDTVATTPPAAAGTDPAKPAQDAPDPVSIAALNPAPN